MSKLRENLLLGFGNPLLDISARVNHEFLKKYNMKPNDAILADESHKNLYDEILRDFDVQYIAGGSVLNTLRVAQWILKKPNICTFFGCVGEDKFSKILEDKAREDGVNVKFQCNDSTPTGTCAVLLNDNHRSLCANLAAAMCFNADHLNKPDNRKILENAEYLYLSGFFITGKESTTREIAQIAHKHNRYFMMNLSAPFIPKLYMPLLQDIMPYVDVLFGNETEAETYAREQFFDNPTDLDSVAQRISLSPKSNNRPRIVIITQGQSPIIVASNNKIEHYPIEPIAQEKIVDTNGAGDAFVGGFLAQFIQGKSINTCIKCGIWSAKSIIQRPGCTYDGETPNFDDESST